jgi:hypothetical protein
MSNKIGQVVEMTNIDGEDFTHSYGGTPFTVRKGETITFPYDIGLHLAKHLARKILIRGDKGATSWRADDPTNNGGNGFPIWNEESEESMIKRILGESYAVESEREKTDIEKLQAEIARLNEFRKTFEEDATTTPTAPAVSGDIVTMNRKELFAEAKRLGLKAGLSDTNDDIRKLIESSKQESEV